MANKIKGASFFAGIGGFDLGFQKSGIEPVFHCEIDDFCMSVLSRHWPNVGTSRDIRELDPSTVPQADVWFGGFPCQDVSVARGWLGRSGFKGENSGLFYPFADLIESKRPKVVVIENVTGLLNSHNGQDFAILLHTLGELGYGVSWRTLNTRYFGAPQSRPRVFICAWKGSADSAYHVLFEQGSYKTTEKERLGFLRPTTCESTGAIVPEIAFCLAATSGRHTGTDWSRSYVSYSSEVRRLTPTECERIQGYPANWTLPTKDFKALRNDLDSLRYKAIGNAVSVPVAKWIGKRVMQEMSNPSPKLNCTELFGDIVRFKDYTPELNVSKNSLINLPEITGHSDAPRIKWANSGVMDGLTCLMGAMPHSPRKPKPSRFIDSLDDLRPDQKYFLSPNAAEGILRRVNGQGRKLFPPLYDALEKLQIKGSK